MKKITSFLSLLAALIVLFAGVHPANADLQARGAVSPAHGFPAWYQDFNGLALSPCLDQTPLVAGVPGPTACVLNPGFDPDPGNPGGPFRPITTDRTLISTTTFPTESFYYMASTSGLQGGIDVIVYEAALEAGFAGAVVNGNQAAFTRVRVRANVSQLGTYIVTHPYGVETIVVDALNPTIDFTNDVPGLVANQFDAPLNPVAVGFPAPFVGPRFLTNALGTFFIHPVTGNRHIGNNATPVAVIGGLNGINSVTITGPAGTFTSSTFVLSSGPIIGFDVAPAGAQAFGIWKVGATSTPVKTFTVTNLTGVLTGVPVITPPAGFTLAVNNCLAGLNPATPGNSCSFDIAFSPTANGIASGNITIAATGVPTAIIPVTGIGDSLSPTVNLVPVIPFTKLTTQTITGTVADNVGGAGVASVNVTVTSNGIPGAVQTVLPVAGTWTLPPVTFGPDSINSISVTASDLALPLPGNTSVAAAPDTIKTITVDNTVPIVAINNVTSPTQSSSQTITGTASDFNGISTFTVSVNSIVKGTTVVAGDGTWSFNVTEMPLNADNIITATATDPAGNSTTSNPSTITVDTGINPFTLTAVTSPTKALTQDIGGTIEANSTVTVAVNGGIAQSATVTVNTWSFTVSLTNEGNNTFIVSATDSLGNTASQPTATIVRDTQVNPFTLNPVTALTKAATQAISGTVEAGSTVTIAVNGGTAQTALVTGNSWSFTVSLTAPDGIKNIVVSANDALGNTAALPAASIILDTTPPELTLAAVTTPTKSNSQTITGTMEAGATVAVNNQPATVTGATTWSFTFSLTAPDGTKTITVTATDAATNVNTALSSIILDTTAPALTFALTAENTPTRVTSQTISGTVEAGATVFVTTNTTAAATHVDVVGPTWSTTILGLVEGINIITVTATDPAGNSAIRESSIKIVFPDGKITGTATVNINDALKALQFAAGLILPTAEEALHADVAPLVNGKPSPNGKVDIGDVVLVLRKVVEPASW